MARLRDRIVRFAASPEPVLITGESGVGKEIAALLLHEASCRSGPFSAVNVGGTPATLFDSLLFGHVRGAFTGADCDTKGQFEIASRGTLFLDEIGDLPYELQVRLLRALQQRQILPVGGARPVPVDTRVVAATNVDLRTAIAERRFREDLLHRLNVLRLHVPSLEERREDIPDLAHHFAHEANAHITDRAAAWLRMQRFQGNVRELRNLVVRAALLRGPHLDVRDFECAQSEGAWT